MTNREILQTSLLDLLFENKNKQYGAYTLRKYYGKRMTVAVVTSLSGALLLFYLLGNTGRVPEMTMTKAPEEVVLKTFELPKEELTLPPQPAASSPVERATIDHQQIEIVPDHLADTEVPTTEQLVEAAISHVTQSGTPDAGLPPLPADHSAAATTTMAPAEIKPFDPVEQQPQFPGGVEAWRQFLSRHLQVPEEMQAGERKTVQVKFFVSTTGEVTQFEILQSAGSSFDREVMRVLKKMPRWKPAIQNGHPIAISFVQPVTFQAFEE